MAESRAQRHAGRTSSSDGIEKALALEEAYRTQGQIYMNNLRSSGGDFEKAAARSGIPLETVFEWAGDVKKRYQLNVVAQAAGNTNGKESAKGGVLDFTKALLSARITQAEIDGWGAPVKDDLKLLEERGETLRDGLLSFWQQQNLEQGKRR